MRKYSLWAMIIGAIVLVYTVGVTLFIVVPKTPGTHAHQGQVTIYHCPMHPNYLSHKPGNCPICGMKLVPVNEGEDNGGSIRIDPAMIQSIGVQTEEAVVRTLTRDIRTSATVMPDERRVSTITTKVMGYIEKLYVDFTGERVKKGQPLFDLYSPDLVSAQAEYLQTYHYAAASDTGQLLQSARQRLLNWDVSESQLADLEKRGAPEKTTTVVSPADGVVTEKMVVKGQAIEPGMKLYTIVDYSKVWVEAAVYQQDIPFVKVGQRGAIDLDFYPGESFSGTVTYIAPELDKESRTLLVRLELANTPDVKIKPGMNTTVTLHAVMNKSAVSVPDQAVIHSGLRTLVVVAKGGGYFEPREIKVGQTDGKYTEVIEGVREGEEIVVSSQFLIDSESNLKAAIMKLAGKKDSTGAVSIQTEKSAQQLYTCPMHPDVIRDKPGSCPICGMNLVPKKAEEAPKMEDMKGMKRE
jgi:membrane fusion protein, copper/silver efflux system